MDDEIDAVISKMLHIRLKHLEVDKRLMSYICSVGAEDIPFKSTPDVFDEPCRPEFNPPYDSPIEESFAWNIIKYLDKAVILKKQTSIDTLCGQFRLDFSAHRAGRSIGLECDGEEYHCFSRDEWRDAMILDSGIVAAIYRFRGKDIFSRIEDCLFILSIWEPQLFLERGHANLKAQASNEARTAICNVQIEKISNICIPYQECRYEYGISIERRSCVPAVNGSRRLIQYADFAKQFSNGNLDQLMQQFDAVNRLPSI